MRYLAFIVFTFQFLLCSLWAQEEEDSLIPARKNTSPKEVDYIGVKDPFAPKIATPAPAKTAMPTAQKIKPADIPSLESEVTNKKLEEEIENTAPTNTQPKIEDTQSDDNLGQLTNESTPTSTTESKDSWENELLNGNDEDFKPAPLRLGNENSVENSEAPAEVNTEPVITPTATFIIPEEEVVPSPTPTPISSPTISPRTDTTKEQVKPADLVTEEIDPWDDPRKKISTTCRLQLERIKKKKIMLDRADGTHMRLQESLKLKNGDLQKMKDISTKLELKIKDIKREMQVLKEKAIRQGCPGIYF